MQELTRDATATRRRARAVWSINWTPTCAAGWRLCGAASPTARILRGSNRASGTLEPRRRSSVAERLFCKQRAVGSNPSAGCLISQITSELSRQITMPRYVLGDPLGPHLDERHQRLATQFAS